MLTGDPLFPGEDEVELYEQIIQMPIVFPDILNEVEKEFLSALLERDPNKRLGCMPQAEEYIMYHNYFSSSGHNSTFEPIDWEALKKKEVEPPYKIHVSNDKDTSYFDEEFTSERPELLSFEGGSSIDFTKRYKDSFRGFSFTNLHFDDQ